MWKMKMASPSSGKPIRARQPRKGTTWMKIPRTTQRMISATKSTSPCFACHWTSASSFSVTRGIRASGPRYARASINPRFWLAPPGGGGIPAGGGGGVEDGGGGTFGSLIAEVSFPRNDHDPLTSVYTRAIRRTRTSRWLGHLQEYLVFTRHDPDLPKGLPQ